MHERSIRSAKAMTLLELVLVIAVLAVLAAVFLPARSQRIKGTVFPCMNNLHQLGVGMMTFAYEQQRETFPSQISVTNGGAWELAASNSPALVFRTLSPYLRGPDVFACPADKARTAVTNFNGFNDANVSYFVSLDATPERANAILAGDRNLEVAGKAATPGLLLLTTNLPVGWTRDMHTRFTGSPCGNMLFADGHVQRLNTNVVNVVCDQGLATNRLMFP